MLKLKVKVKVKVKLKWLYNEAWLLLLNNSKQGGLPDELGLSGGPNPLVGPLLGGTFAWRNLVAWTAISPDVEVGPTFEAEIAYGCRIVPTIVGYPPFFVLYPFCPLKTYLLALVHVHSFVQNSNTITNSSTLSQIQH